MAYTGMVYFLGKYRPLAIECSSLAEVKLRLAYAIQEIEPELREWLRAALNDALRNFKSYGYRSVSIDHCDRGISLRQGKHDAFLSKLIAELPACPGLNYNA